MLNVSLLFLLILLCVPPSFGHEVKGTMFLGLNTEMSDTEKFEVLRDQGFVCYTDRDFPGSNGPGFCLSALNDVVHVDSDLGKKYFSADIKLRNRGGIEFYCDAFVKNCATTSASEIAKALSAKFKLDLYREMQNFNRHPNYVCDYDHVGQKICFLPAERSLTVNRSVLRTFSR